MEFVKKYKKGGDKNEDAGQMGGYIYLSKRHTQDTTLRLQKAFVKVSDRPSTQGQEKLLFVFEVVELGAACGQGDLQVGDIVSYMLNPSQADALRAEFELKEAIDCLSALTGTRTHDYFKSLQNSTAKQRSLLEKHFEDDCAIAQGQVVHVTTPQDPNKGWYTLVWENVTVKSKVKSKAA